MKTIFALFFISIAVQAKIPKHSLEKLSQKLKQDFASELCTNDSYFVQCFRVNSAKCKKQVNSSLDQCLRKKRVFKQKVSEEKYEKLAYKVGACTGKLYEKKFKKIKSSSRSCRF